MAAMIRMKLSDLLKTLEPNQQYQNSFSGIHEAELAAICEYLQSAGQVRRRDLEFEFHLTRGAVLRRLDLLKERGLIEELPGHRYALKADPGRKTLAEDRP